MTEEFRQTKGKDSLPKGRSVVPVGLISVVVLGVWVVVVVATAVELGFKVVVGLVVVVGAIVVVVIGSKEATISASTTWLLSGSVKL